MKILITILLVLVCSVGFGQKINPVNKEMKTVSLGDSKITEDANWVTLEAAPFKLDTVPTWQWGSGDCKIPGCLVLHGDLIFPTGFVLQQSEDPFEKLNKRIDSLIAVIESLKKNPFRKISLTPGIFDRNIFIDCEGLNGIDTGDATIIKTEPKKPEIILGKYWGVDSCGRFFSKPVPLSRL